MIMPPIPEQQARMDRAKADIYSQITGGSRIAVPLKPVAINGVRFDRNEDWFVCDECKNASENRADFVHDPTCSFAPKG